MIKRILLDVGICLVLWSRFFWDNEILDNVASGVVFLLGVITFIACVAGIAIIRVRNLEKKAFKKNELEVCNNFFTYRVYEPLSDACIAFSLAAIGHYILGTIYFMICSFIRGVKYTELKEYQEEEKNGCESN